MDLSQGIDTMFDSDIDDDPVFIGLDDVGDYNPGNILPESQGVLGDITSWLKPTDYDSEGSEYRKHCSFHLAGTGDWIISTPTYEQWHKGPDRGILWVRGAPGSGKSVLAATMITRLRQEGCPVLYFFYRHTIAANHHARAAVRDWLAQVLHFSPPLQLQLKERVKEIAGKDASVETLSLPTLFDLLRTALFNLPKAYILVDALDEMDQASLEPFLHHLNELGEETAPPGVKIIMTSRPVAVIEKTVRGLNILDVRLDKQRVESDIAAYVQHRLADSSIPADEYTRAVETVVQRCDGLFLYARLAMDQFLEHPHWNLNDVLENIPTGLGVVYAKILEEQRARSDLPTGVQQFILQCVTHTTRPLRLLEIADLINVARDLGDLGTTKSVTRLACGPLLEILPDETVHVVHHSLTEFLNGTTRDAATLTAASYPVFEEGPIHNLLALCCIAYLRSGVLVNVDMKMVKLRQQTVLPPFMRYAATNWHVHARKAALAGHDQSKVDRQTREMLASNDLEMLAILGGADKACSLTPLGLAAAFGKIAVARALLEESEAKGEEDWENKDVVLRFCAKQGDAELVRLLLEHGADVKAYDDWGYGAMHLAVRQGRQEVVRVLLEAGADPFLPQGEIRQSFIYTERSGPASSPAHDAFSTGSMEIVSLFIPYLNTPKLANWALYEAISTRMLDVIEDLLQIPFVDVNAKLGLETPLYMACAKRDAGMIEVLLKAGADPNILHKWGGMSREKLEKGHNALHALSGANHHVFDRTSDEAQVRRCFKLVLDAGANINQTDVKGVAPLHIAEDVVAVQCLLEAGANASLTNNAGETLLHMTNNVDILRLLAGRVDINTNSQYRSRTPLMSILTDRRLTDDNMITKANFLLDLGADASCVDDEGNGTVHHVVTTDSLGAGGLSFLQRLLENGADVNLQNHDGQTPLHRSVPGYKKGSFGTKDEAKVLEILLAAGADLETTDKLGRTPLFQMVESRFGYHGDRKLKACERLLALGARIDATDLQGRNLLHCTVQTQWPETDVMRFLVSHGIDPKATDNKGNTLWHLAAPGLSIKAWNAELVSELTAMGIDPEQRNNDKQTPLHIVASYHPYAFRQCTTSSAADGRPRNADDEGFFDHFIGLCESIDCIDRDGVTPLHITSTFSEYLTLKLLKAGADIRKPTREGLTTLHLAARSRQTNVLALLLAWLKDQFYEGTVEKTCNSPDRLGRTALYYAAASGVSAAVKMLLDAGAAVDTGLYSGSPWEGCIALDEEAKCRWRWSIFSPNDLDSLRLILLGS